MVYSGPKSEKLKPYRKSFHRLYFHELIPFLVVYPCFTKTISKETIYLLRKLIPIRNKIAHNICLNKIEIELLNTLYINIEGMFMNS